ncbi:hypothetical protein [Klebsiella pneumoniae]|uniref:hypothetical protein n=1 Tax=Klebsiella pneumoniae TaxID=573 RepID=UPI0022ABFB44|nr:hypothetical protein [Klebsiella pneumoniae]
MKKLICAVLLTIIPLTTVAATIPEGKIENPFVVGNEVVCLKEIQKKITPYLKSFEEKEGEQR